MPSNIEVKARISDTDQLLSTLSSLSLQVFAQLWQEDVFFSVPRGRLKMRCDLEGQCELIYYRRHDEPGPSISNYYRHTLPNPEVKRLELLQTFGIKNVVRKRRIVYLFNDIRIHIDSVEGLGDFIEIEVPIGLQRDLHHARYTARQLMKQLFIAEEDLISIAYDDMLLDANTGENDIYLSP